MKNKIIDHIKIWESRCYINGIPDEVDSDLESTGKVPTYKAICVAILKNDRQLKSLGYQRTKSLYYDDIKKIELKQRGVNIQLKLF